eukprot:175443-Pelagomonas_calceolata.AAC.1
MMTFWERAYKANGSFEADRMFLVVECACAVLEDCAFHSSWDAGHVPEGNANALACIRYTWSCLFPSQPSDVVKGVAAWASARDTGISQFVNLEARLILSNRICTFIPSYTSMKFDPKEKDVTWEVRASFDIVFRTSPCT